MRWKLSSLLGIGVQNMLLVVALVALTGWFLPQYIQPVAESLQWKNEKVILKGETSQQAYALYDKLTQVKREVFLLYCDVNLRQTNGPDWDNLLKEMRQDCLRFGVWPVRRNRDGNGFVVDKDRMKECWDLDPKGTAGSDADSTAWDDGREEIINVNKPTKMLETSSIRWMPWTEKGAPEQYHYVVWIGKFVGVAGNDANPTKLVMAAVKMDDALRQIVASPQCLGAVFQNGRLLVPPVGLPGDETKNNFGACRKAAEGLFRANLYSSNGQVPDGFFSKAERSLVSPAKSEKPLQGVPLSDAHVRFFSAESNAIDLDRVLEKAAIEAIQSINNGWIEDEWAGRAPCLRRASLSENDGLHIRLLSSDEGHLPEMQNMVRARLAGLTGQDPGPDMFLGKTLPAGSTCDLSYVQLGLAPDNSQRNLVLAHAMFDRDLGWVEYWPWIWGVIAALIGLVASLVITRPLEQITRAAEHITCDRACRISGGDHCGQALAKLNLALPTWRWDEIGVLARAFREMLAEIGQSHEQLLELNRELEGRVERRTRQLEEAKAKLESTVRVLQETNVELTKAHEAQKRFVFSISHDLKTPLTTIKGYCELLMQSTLSGEQREDLGTIYTARERLQRLIEDIIDSHKIDLTELELDWKEVQVPALVHEIGRAMTPSVQKNGNTLQLECAENIPPMYSDPDKISRVLTNLLNNAAKFTRQGTITLHAACDHRDGRDWLLLSVADTGPGIDRAHQDRIFKPFPKILEKKDNPDGTGLGLSNCKGYCEAMGGTIAFTSELGHGTTFTVHLPLQPEKDIQALRLKQSQSRRLSAPRRFSAASQGNGVLVIDDEEEIRQLLKRFLEQRGFTVALAADGDEGLALAKKLQPVLITLDAIMPGRDGWTLLKDLKADAETCDIPVIMVSVLDDKYKGFALGASEYITKPIDWDQLTRTLENFNGAGPASILVVDDDPEIRAMAGRHLAAQGWKVVEAENGRAALDRLDEGCPNVILLDLLMPQMDGFEFIEHLRGRVEWSHIPVIVVTAKDLSGSEREQLNGGVVRVIQKGAFQWADLEANISHFVTRYVKPAETEKPPAAPAMSVP
jgi:signal transduction histidine kinase/CheY-like chemotaxis protein